MAGTSTRAAVSPRGRPLAGPVVLGLFLGLLLLVMLALAAAIGFLWVIHFRHLPTWTVSLAGVTIALGALVVYWRTMRYLIRRRFQFSLRAALAATALVAVGMGLVSHRIQFVARQQRAIWALWQQGSGAEYCLVFADESAWFHWLIQRFGFDPFGKVSEVSVRSDATLDTLLEHAEEFPDLENISFNSGVTDLGLQRLPELNRFPSLKTVNFLSTPMTDAGLEHLANLPQLEALYLTSGKITDSGLVHLQKLPRLKELSLEGSKITDAGLAHLQALSGLERLRFNGTPITDAGLEHLKPLHNLRELSFVRTRL